MTNEYVKAICLFCDATVEGAEEFMLNGKRYDGKGGWPERWLKEKPEYKWLWNGLTTIDADGKEKSAKFYLCPAHRDDEHFKEAMDWADAHSRRELPIEGK